LQATLACGHVTVNPAVCRLFDGGEDKVAATEDDNLLFAVQGYYVS
jgi:hypothetical protein